MVYARLDLQRHEAVLLSSSAVLSFCPFQSLVQEARLHAAVSLGSRDA